LGIDVAVGLAACVRERDSTMKTPGLMRNDMTKNAFDELSGGSTAFVSRFAL
jgi:hypothetical protein